MGIEEKNNNNNVPENMNDEKNENQEENKLMEKNEINQTENIDLNTDNDTEKTSWDEPSSVNNEINAAENAETASPDKTNEEDDNSDNNDNIDAVAETHNAADNEETKPEDENKKYVNKKPHYNKKNQVHKNHKRGNHNNNKTQNGKPRKNYRRLISEALKVPIIQIASKLGLLITQQKTTKCINPSHFDNSSSMYFDEEKNRYKCDMCGTSGNNIDMVRSVLRITRNKAAEWILDKVENTEEYMKFIPEDRKKKILTGEKDDVSNNYNSHNYKKTSPPKNRKHISTSNKKYSRERDEFSKERERLLKSGEIHRMYWFIKNNLMPISKIRIGLSFIKDKNINSETMDNLEIGILLNHENIKNELCKKYKTEELLAAGLLQKDESDKKETDGNKEDYKFTFRDHNVIFPYISGKTVVYLQGRRLDNKEPVYVTSTQGQPFIYNYNILRDLKEKQTLIICTDIVEAVSLIDKGFNVINIVNAERFRPDWANNIPCKKIILVTDDDVVKKRIGSIFSKQNINIRISDYNELSSTPRKNLNSVGELFKSSKKNNKDKPFWKNSGK